MKKYSCSNFAQGGLNIKDGYNIANKNVHQYAISDVYNKGLEYKKCLSYAYKDSWVNVYKINGTSGYRLTMR